VTLFNEKLITNLAHLDEAENTMKEKTEDLPQICGYKENIINLKYLTIRVPMPAQLHTNLSHHLTVLHNWNLTALP
jgi:hypothetical protein